MYLSVPISIIVVKLVMKKILAILILIMPHFFALGQVYYLDNREELLSPEQNNKKYRTHIVAAKISVVQRFSSKRNSKISSIISEARFDNRGNNTDWFEYKGNGKVETHNTASYNDSNQVTRYASYNGGGKLKEMFTYTYDKSGNQVEQDRYKHDPKTPASKEIHTYNDRNNMTETRVFDKKGNLKSRVEYTYYDDGSHKQTIRYSGKGKVERIWNFDCNPVGAQEAKKFKDTNKVCIHYETDKDGNQIKVKEEYEGGTGLFSSTTRIVTKIDKNNNIIDYAWYKLNGKPIWRCSTLYDASGNITEYTIYQAGTPKPFWRTVYTYNSDNNIVSSVIYKKLKPLPEYTLKWVYNSSVSKAQ